VEKAGLVSALLRTVKAGAPVGPIVLSAGAPVSGAVRRPDGRSPAAGALVRLEGRAMTRWVETGMDGSFTIPDAPKGTVTVVADAAGAGYFEQAGVALPLAQGRCSRWSSGRHRPWWDEPWMRDRSPGAANQDRASHCRPTPYDAIRSGRNLCPAGPAAGVMANARGRAAIRPWTHARVPLQSAERKKLDIPLVLGASLSGRVTDENGQPVANARGR